MPDDQNSTAATLDAAIAYDVTQTRAYTPEEHSSVVGGSTANRRIMCPKSYQLEQRLPPQTKDEESSYAAEGTALHEAMAHILNNDITLAGLNDMVGMTFYGYTLDHDLVADALVPCVNFLDDLNRACNTEGGFEFEVETRCKFPDIEGAFGTSDLVGRTDRRSIIVDWKFGGGKPVFAWKAVDIEDFPFARMIKMPFSELMVPMIGNPQLMFYALAAMNQHPDLFEDRDDWPVELYICQPRIAEAMGQKVSRHSTNVGELRAFKKVLMDAIENAQSDSPMLAAAKGDHCNWCRCQPICPRWTAPVLDLTKAFEATGLAEIKKTDKMPVEEYGQLLSLYLDLFDAIEELQSETQLAAFNLLQQGIDVPNWCLKPKRAGPDKWVDDVKAEAYLGRQGVPLAERRVVKTMTPAAARAALKKLGKELKSSYVAEGTSSGMTLGRTATTKDPIKVPSAKEIASKLAGLVGQS